MKIFVRWLRGGVASCGVLLLLHVAALGAPVSAHDLRDYYHTVWSSESGLGSVFDIGQAQSGYLWLTTSKGVYRFDGVRFQSVGEATNGAVKDGDVDSAFASSFGGVWFVTRSQGMLFWKDYKVTVFPDRRCTPGRRPDGIAEDADGSLWFASSAGLFHLREGVCEQVPVELDYPGGYPSAILMDHVGTLWVKMPSGELLYLRRGMPKFQRSEAGYGPVLGFAYLHDAPNGSIWLSDGRGLRKIAESASAKFSSFVPRGTQIADRFGNFAFDLQGALWVATGEGIERIDDVSSMPVGANVSSASGSKFTTQQGFSSDAIWKLLVDREGNLWVVTNSGLDRLRRNVFSTVRLPATQNFQIGIAAGEQGSLWVGSRSLPLTHIAADGSFHSFPETVQSLMLQRDRNGDIWSSGKGRSSLWKTEDKGLVAVPYPNDTSETGVALAVDKNNDLWFSTSGPNILHRTGKVWKNENAAIGRKPGVMGTMAADDDGNVWFAFSNKLVEWDGKQFNRFEFPDGPLNISVATLGIHGGHVWMGGAGGILLFKGGEFHRVQWQDASLPGRVSGIVETPEGELWVNGFSGVVHIPASELRRLIADPNYAVSAERFDALDGLPGLAGERYPEPSLVRSPEGRLWFSTTKEVAWIDPAELEESRNRTPPPVAIDAVIADGRDYMGQSPVHFPAHTENLQFDYTALSLSLPERVRFRYILEGIDKDWQNASTRRQAFYTNLSPGSYRFRVTACNNDGVWNEEGTYLDFVIAPAFYQTWWFRSLSVLALAVALWLLVQMRINRVTSQLQARLAERSDERERIARELHDTLLQSLFGVMLQFHAIADRLSAENPARQVLAETLTRADTVMQEGRERVRNLRTRQSDSGVLIDALSTTGYELQALRPAKFQLQVKGRPRPLKSDIQEEILLIGREALTNAFVHSQAQTIGVGIIFRFRHFVLLVQDNGQGIDESIRRAWGREGHWGLRGMRERADKIGARLEIRHVTTGGTQVHLAVPARIAYSSDYGTVRRLWLALRSWRGERS
jgi:signal transduction histidine kinase/ligand-binding sensor domain-containing protein